MNTAISILSNGVVTHLAAGAAGAVAVWWAQHRTVLNKTVDQLKSDVAQLKAPAAPATPAQ